MLGYNCLKQTSKDSMHKKLQQTHGFFYFNYLFLLIGFTRHIWIEIRGRDRFYILPRVFWKWDINYRNGRSLHGGFFAQENSPSVYLFWVQWLTTLNTQSLCVCWQKSLQYKRFNSNTSFKYFGKMNRISHQTQLKGKPPSQQKFDQTPDASVLLLWQNQNYFNLIEFL